MGTVGDALGEAGRAGLGEAAVGEVCVATARVVTAVLAVWMGGTGDGLGGVAVVAVGELDWVVARGGVGASGGAGAIWEGRALVLVASGDTEWDMRPVEAEESLPDMITVWRGPAVVLLATVICAAQEGRRSDEMSAEEKGKWRWSGGGGVLGPRCIYS